MSASLRHAMDPHGLALEAYFAGKDDAEILVRRDDGLETPLPVRYFFRTAADLVALEVDALERCRGHVLDLGAGTGLHSLLLQERGLQVTALDISPQAVEIMRRRGVADARHGDVFEFHDGPFDTLLMLGHGIGIAGDLEGMDRFLAHARGLLGPGGQALVHSLDVRRTEDPAHLAYHQAQQEAGRYVGEIRVQFEYAGQRGPFCGWLQVDPGTLAEYAEPAGWRFELVHEAENGDYLARLELPS